MSQHTERFYKRYDQEKTSVVALEWPSLFLIWSSPDRLRYGTQTTGRENDYLHESNPKDLINIFKEKMYDNNSTTEETTSSSRKRSRNQDTSFQVYEVQVETTQVPLEREWNVAKCLPEKEDFIAVGTEENYIELFNIKQSDKCTWDPKNRRAHKPIEAVKKLTGIDQGNGFCLEWNHENVNSLLACTPKKICIWKILDDTPKATTFASDIELSWACWNGSDSCYGVGERGSFVQWDLRQDAKNANILNLGDSRKFSVVASKGDCVLTGEESGAVCIWDAKKLDRPVSTMNFTRKAVTHLVWSNSSDKRFASASEDGYICLWDVRADNSPFPAHVQEKYSKETYSHLVFQHSLHRAAVYKGEGHAQVNDLVFHPQDENYIASVDTNNYLQIWRPTDEELSHFEKNICA